jgi:UDP-2,3-diacylglucosamine hydrolase
MRVFLFGDSHFGSPSGTETEEERVERFLKFTEEIGEGDTLVLLGDIFDFWFEYKYVIPRAYFPILEKICEVVKRAEVYYVCGNHDLWVGDFFEELGLKVERDHLELSFPSYRAYLFHGDHLQGSNRVGKITRFVLGNRATRFLFHMVHPDLGFAIAKAVSKLSRGRSEGKRFKELVPGAVRELFKSGYKVVGIGHIHIPLLRRIEGGIFLSIGDWLWNFTYAILEENRVRLLRYPAEVVEEAYF